MVESGGVVKYLIYAFGEILLVMIGILLALQVNNWNENRKNRIQEVAAMQNIRADFLGTIDNLNRADRIYELSHEQMEDRYRLIGMPEAELTDSMLRVVRLTGFAKTEIILSSLDALLNSGNLDLISSDSLKKKLSSYPVAVEIFKEQEEIAYNILLEQHRPILEKSVTLLENRSRNISEYPHLRNGIQPHDLRKLINTREYQNAIYNQHHHTRRTQRYARELLKKTRSIVHLIDMDIGSDVRK